MSSRTAWVTQRNFVSKKKQTKTHFYEGQVKSEKVPQGWALWYSTCLA